MTAKSYSVEYIRQGPSGLQQVIAHVYDASTGDTLNECDYFGATGNRDWADD